MKIKIHILIAAIILINASKCICQYEFIIPQYYPSSYLYYTGGTLSNTRTYEYQNKQTVKETVYRSNGMLYGYTVYSYQFDTLLYTMNTYDDKNNLTISDTFYYNSQNKQVSVIAYQNGILSYQDSTYYLNDTTSLSMRKYPPSSNAKNIRVYNHNYRLLIDTFMINNSIDYVHNYIYKNDTLLASYKFIESYGTFQMELIYNDSNILKLAKAYQIGGFNDTNYYYYDYNQNNKLSKLSMCQILQNQNDTNSYYIFKYDESKIKMNKINIDIMYNSRDKFLYLKGKCNYSNSNILLNGRIVKSVSSNIEIRNRKH